MGFDTLCQLTTGLTIESEYWRQLVERVWISSTPRAKGIFVRWVLTCESIPKNISRTSSLCSQGKLLQGQDLKMAIILYNRKQLLDGKLWRTKSSSDIIRKMNSVVGLFFIPNISRGRKWIVKFSQYLRQFFDCCSTLNAIFCVVSFIIMK